MALVRTIAISSELRLLYASKQAVKLATMKQTAPQWWFCLDVTAFLCKEMTQKLKC